ncbi:hypothetical protein KAFR_0E04410 [Kazachstania africana CBS 2517]|uniref:Sulfite reductase [NADPH] subunit beta n=1 Tax=Kazachstania africana (strain ATCC 22294 / BCRC 22015 / CBS 2517 / CECT 1963 / NBRC 1671 / NRRL Y-8276) TaxID=1071382 RepID=H2AW41_KAZAF|nr:hypothetical protein KAFR_0E04410 [Kazachstania africana CBS 2517]CCF58591.1 hypothetical protein KAFR_0E04410 [Kazachstania africana CBS 2517]
MALNNCFNALQPLHHVAGLYGSKKTFYTAPSKAKGSSRLDDLIGVEAVRLLSQHDPFGTISSAISADALSSIFTEQTTLLRSLPQLYNLKGHPVVITVDLHVRDYSVIPALKDFNYITLVSSSAPTLLKHAQLANKLAISTKSPVFHFVDLANISDTFEGPEIEIQDTDIPEEPVDIETILSSDEHFSVVSDAATATAPDVALINLSPYGNDFSSQLPHNSILIDINIYRPWNFDQLLTLIPPSVNKIAIVQGSCRKSETKGFEPLLLDFFTDFNKIVERKIDQVVVCNVGTLSSTQDALEIIINNVTKPSPETDLYLGKQIEHEEYSDVWSSSIENVLHLESAYIKVLQQLFSSNLQVLNEYNSETVNGNSPEFGYGLFLHEQKAREELVGIVKSCLDASLFHTENANRLVELLSEWLALNDKPLDESELNAANEVADELYKILETNQDSQAALNILNVAPSAQHFEFKSSWLVGSDAWSFDLGNSGVHQVLSSKKNINMLLIDSEPHDVRRQSHERKKDVGLYAMNFHHVYVASVAVYSSYTQMLAAFIEASRFNGPSIVLAYLPYHNENDTPLEVLKETKNAVESGYWPLYRFDPSKDDIDGEESFQLDSSVLKKELQSFLDRENKLTLLTRRNPELSRTLATSASDAITRKQEKRAKAAFDELLEGLSGPPVHIYYASDGGNASGLAAQLGNRASARGLKATVLSMDDIIVEELAGEENVVFITSTAGQGEFPQDGKSFWDEIRNSSDLDFSTLKFAVFGLADSEYWPRKEDARYYNKPCKDLYARLEFLTAIPLVPLGLGDDQDADGYQTGYAVWEAQLWEALGVSNVEVGDEPKAWTNEDMKINSDFLRGTIVEGLNDTSTLAIHPYDQQLTKFHGCYMQDDRDIREVRKSQGMEPLYSFMIRVRLPGGEATPDQWLLMDKLSDASGNGTFKITTRATFQLHGILKSNLKHSIRALNSELMDTLAACGDVNRNVMVAALPFNAKIHQQIADFGRKVSEHFLPRTTAYHEIWLKGVDDADYDPSWSSIFEDRQDGPNKKKVLVGGNSLVDMEPLYGPTYLPRKFKINIAVPPYNDVDVWSIDVGLVAILNQETSIVEGFNVYAGGGMGTTHNNKKTYPRTASLLGYVEAQDVIGAIEAVMVLQRERGDRKDRKHARLKYTVDDMGNEEFKQKVEELWGKTFAPERPYHFNSNIDHFGWVRDETGLNHFTVFIENGRVANTFEQEQKTGLKKIAELMKTQNSGHFRLTGNQHVLISNIKDEHLEDIKKIMAKYGLDNTAYSGLRLSSSSCVGFPTCGLAMAESERFLPSLITRVEDVLEEYGLSHNSVVMRVTGCPNGCARPWLAEIALVGKALRTYNLYLGGGYYGQRLNKLYKASVKDDEVVDIFRPLFKRWALEREDDEHFGDFLIRAGVVKPTLEGKFFHEDIAEEAY